MYRGGCAHSVVSCFLIAVHIQSGVVPRRPAGRLLLPTPRSLAGGHPAPLERGGLPRLRPQRRGLPSPTPCPRTPRRGRRRWWWRRRRWRRRRRGASASPNRRPRRRHRPFRSPPPPAPHVQTARPPGAEAALIGGGGGAGAGPRLPRPRHRSRWRPDQPLGRARTGTGAASSPGGWKWGEGRAAGLPRQPYKEACCCCTRRGSPAWLFSAGRAPLTRPRRQTTAIAAFPQPTSGVSTRPPPLRARCPGRKRRKGGPASAPTRAAESISAVLSRLPPAAVIATSTGAPSPSAATAHRRGPLPPARDGEGAPTPLPHIHEAARAERTARWPVS